MNYLYLNCPVVDDSFPDAEFFFKVMTRLEFSIKDYGYVKPRGPHNRSAEIDWDRFIDEKLNDELLIAVEKSPEAKILVSSPPKQQVLDLGGNLAWADPQPVTSTKELIIAVRRVRNNLFHGGKKLDPDALRNYDLICAALKVIDLILEKDDIIRAIFRNEC